MTAADYAWVREDPRLDAFCFCAVAGPTALAVILDAFAADRTTETSALFVESANGYPQPSYVLVGEAPGGVLAAENNGWQGVGDDLLRRVSRGGRAVGYYRSVNADMTFALAEDGSVSASFDPLLEPVPERLREEAAGLAFGVDDVEPSAFALLERLTGIALERSWLDEPHLRYDVPSPY
ncbi:MAG TPA: DUF6461 domain-containing protein [Gaiellaceae bacterium]|nr:DUF6461 domain-containing protein [Gaiellaceae bacterium]